MSLGFLDCFYYMILDFRCFGFFYYLENMIKIEFSGLVFFGNSEGGVFGFLVFEDIFLYIMR